MQRRSDQASTQSLPRLATPPAPPKEPFVLPRRRSSAFLSSANSPSSITAPSSALSPAPVSPWVERYKSEAKSEFVHQDVASLLRPFEDLAAMPTRVRKPLNATLLAKHATSTHFAGLAGDPLDPTISSTTAADTSADTAQENSTNNTASLLDTDGHDEYVRRGDGVVAIPGISAARLRRQATKLLIQRRAKTHLAAEQHKRQHFASQIVPTRFLFDSTRWPRASRCDYCQRAGGDLECATCDLIAHAACFLAAYGSAPRKTKGAFVVPTRFSWLCRHCQSSLQTEYDDRAKRARSEYIANQKNVFGKVVKAYVRMTRDALKFKKKKDAIIKIQAILRGRLARLRFDRLQRMRLKPYAVEGMTLHGFRRGLEATESPEDLRLANGFTCNPYVYVTVVDGDDDDLQLFCFETSVARKGVSTLENELVWRHDKLFVPGVNGNVTFCFTVLSKNGPNNFVLGQAVLRLRDSDSVWRSGACVELPLSQEIEIFPRTAQRQPLRLADAAPSASVLISQRRLSKQTAPLDSVFANGSSAAMMLSVHVQPFSDVKSHCGYVLTKNLLDSFQTSQRWCVLADGLLRIYRHYGVTLATETVAMAHTIEITLVETKNVHRQEEWIAMEHITRLYIFQSERSRAATKQWLKKLQAAARCGGGTTGGILATANESSVVKE
jgi:hypothetical protein